jgi:hypothetical protein
MGRVRLSQLSVHVDEMFRPFSEHATSPRARQTQPQRLHRCICTAPVQSGRAFVCMSCRYLEEEAVHTYTRIINEIETGKLPVWQKQPAPPIAIRYWRLKTDAKMLDLMYAIRADESIHRDVNHVFAALPEGMPNPFK